MKPGNLVPKSMLKLSNHLSMMMTIIIVVVIIIIIISANLG